MGEEKKVYTVLVGNVDGRMGSECRLEKLARGSVEWIQLALDRDQ
jgi:hypothetical protein